jgi:hypothetical protein
MSDDVLEELTAPEPEPALITRGSAVKALGNGRIGGYLVVFSTEDDPDLTGDYFTKDTDFGPHTTSLVMYQHAQDHTLKRRVLDDRATLQKDDIGVWVEAQLKMRDEYERSIEQMAKEGKLGWSSGTAPHLVERVRTQKAAWIKSWPLGLDASLTPSPTEPRAQAVALKALMDRQVSAMVDALIVRALAVADSLGITVEVHTENTDEQ